MYRCPRLVDVPVVVELPTVMYKMAPFSLKGPESSPAQLTQSCLGSSALEARQEAVLKRLQNLKEQLDRLQSTRTTAAAAAATTAASLGAAACSSPVKTPGAPIQDLVISASPATPPLSLLVLRRVLSQSGLAVHCSSRLHSSVAQVCPSLQQAFSDSPLEERGKHSLAFSLQWTDVPSPSLMVNPLRQTRIMGEANIIRYLIRLLPPTSAFNYEATGTYATIAEVDQLLDMVERGLLAGGKEKSGVMRELVKRLSRSAYLCGGECGAVDVLAWSALRWRGGAVDEVVGKWLARVDSFAGIDLSQITKQQQQQQQQQQKKKQQQPAQPTTTTTTTARDETKVCRKGETSRLGRKDLENYLKKLAVPYTMKEHKEVFTVDELMVEVAELKGIVTKNLFLRDKKKSLFVLATKHDTEIDLKSLAKKINTKDLRFADSTVLYDTLGVKQGCVSPLAVINDPNHLVRVLLEECLVGEAVGRVYFHPLSNDATLGLDADGLKRFLDATGHQPTLVQF